MAPSLNLEAPAAYELVVGSSGPFSASAVSGGVPTMTFPSGIPGGQLPTGQLTISPLDVTLKMPDQAEGTAILSWFNDVVQGTSPLRTVELRMMTGQTMTTFGSAFPTRVDFISPLLTRSDGIVPAAVQVRIQANSIQ